MNSPLHRLFQVVAIRLVTAMLTIEPTLASEPKPAAGAVVNEAVGGLELSPESSKFIEVATLAAETNRTWGSRIPARVSLQVAAYASVGAVVEGRVEQILVRPGDVVEAGTPLLKVRSVGGGQARAEAEQNEARLVTAEESLRRYAAMAAKGVATELELHEAELRLKEARIDAERTRGANSLLGAGNGTECLITAPTNGVVLSIAATIGTALQPGNDVVEIGDPSKVWIEAELSDEDAHQTCHGRLVLIELPRSSGVLQGTVETVSARVDPVTRRRRIYIVPEGGGDKSFTPGMLVEARLAEPADQLLLPVEAVLIKEGEHRIVYVQGNDGRLRPREVTVNDPSSGRVRILQGLTAGERVVVKGALLVDGRSEQLL